MYTCECGRQFEKQSSLNTHARFCNSYIKKEKPISKYKKNEKLYECECKKLFKNYQSLNAHFSYCLVHRNNIPTTRKFQHQKGIMHGWENFSDEKITQIKKQIIKTLSAKKFKIEDILLGKYPNYPTGKLRIRLIKEGKKEHKCEKCQLTEWLNEPIPLELHHKNGNKHNHLWENLQLLCPNCHTLTPTYKGKNMKKYNNNNLTKIIEN